MSAVSLSLRSVVAFQGLTIVLSIANLSAALSVPARLSANSLRPDLDHSRASNDITGRAAGASVTARAICDSTSVYSVAVTPEAPGSASWTAQTTGHTTTFTVQNTGDCNDTYQFAVSATGPIPPVVTLNKTSASVIHGGSTTVIATYDVGNPDTGSITLTASSAITGASAQNSYVVTAVTGAPTNWDISPFNHDNQLVHLCSVACFAVTYAQSTVPYFSLDAPRSATLAYDGDRVWPKPFVLLNVQKPSGTPDTIFFQVRKAGVWQTFVNGETLLKFLPASSGWQRIGGQLRDSTWATGMYDVDVVVTWHYAGGSTTVQTWTTKLLVVNETSSSIARGWIVAGSPRAYPQADNSVLITEGDGSAVFFRKRGATTFFAPVGDFSTLLVNGTGWKRLYPDSTVVYFNSAGRITDAYDRFNNRTQFIYDGSNRLTTIRDPNSQDLVLAYGSYGLSSIRDNLSPNRYTNITVLSDSSLTAIQDPDGVSTTFQYDGNRRLWKTISRRGDTTTMNYQTISGIITGKLASVTEPTVPVYGEGAVSPVTSYAPWQTVGVPYSVTASSPWAAVLPDTVYARVTDPGGHVLKFTVNRWGTSAVATDALGRTDSTLFDASGLPIRIRSANGAVDSTAYDSNGLPIYVKSAGYPASIIRYGAWAQVDSVRVEDGSAGIRYFIGANGRIDSVRVAGGTSDSAKTKIHYDTRGRPDSVIDPLGHLVKRTWFAGTNGNRSKDSLPGGRVTTYTYDAYGRQTGISVPGLATRTTYYSVVNRADSVRDGVDTLPTRYAYDSLFLVSVTDPKNQTYRFSYNALGWLLSRTDATNHSELYEYSRDGELRRWTNRRGEAITSLYDALHRRTSKSGTNTATESWAYPNDTLLVATSPVALDSLVSSRYGQLLQVTTSMAGQTYKRLYRYTSAGALDSMIPSGAGITFQARHYTWNLRLGTLTGIKLGPAAAGSTSIVADRDGLASTVTLNGGDVLTQNHNSLHATADIATSASYASSVNRSAGFDAANRIRRHVTTPTDGHQYTYDGLGRVTADSTIHNDTPPCDPLHTQPDPNGDSCVFGAGWTVNSGVSFSYDSAGNRRDLGGTYKTGNRISAFDGCTYIADTLGDGNVTSRTCGGTTVTFAWTAENRLASITSSGQTTTFDYNASGRLVKAARPGWVHHFLWDGDDNLLAELDSAGTTEIAEYSYYPGVDNPHALIAGGTKYFAHDDIIGSVAALTDSSLNLARVSDYTAFGKTWTSADFAGLNGKDRTRFKGALFFGDVLDDLYYLRNRWYEPRTGRFLSEDPLGISAGINQYVYAGNDPVNASDPSGLLLIVISTSSGDVAFDCFEEVPGKWVCHAVGIGGISVVGAPNGSTELLFPPRPGGGDSWRPPVDGPGGPGRPRPDRGGGSGDNPGLDGAWSACRRSALEAGIAVVSDVFKINVIRGATNLARAGRFGTIAAYAAKGRWTGVATYWGAKSLRAYAAGITQTTLGSAALGYQIGEAVTDDENGWLYNGMKLVPILGSIMSVGEMLGTCAAAVALSREK